MARSSRIEPKSSHVSDASLQPFLQPDFDPAAYLNATLPPLSSSTRQQGSSVPLNDLSTQTQTLLSQLNAQTSRLSTTLTQLTDEIIRSGSRLAYEVDLLKGEAIGLTDALNGGLRKDVELLAPSAKANGANPQTSEPAIGAPKVDVKAAEPTHLTRLRTLTEVRTRLDAVIQLFGRAMAWPLSPSEQTSLTASLISVSAPTGETEAELRTRETKAKEFTDKIRTEINELTGSGNDVRGLEEAAEKVEELRVLAQVWEGTAEEKARKGFVEGLGRVMEERERVVRERGGGVGRGGRPGGERVQDMRYGNLEAGSGQQGGYGFMRGLRKLGDGVYLD